MTKWGRKPAAITIKIPARFWTQSSDELGELKKALTSEDDAFARKGVRTRFDFAEGIVGTVEDYQKGIQEISQKDAVPDFKEMWEVPEHSQLHKYAWELVRSSSYNLANVKRAAKTKITKVQQIRDHLASRGITERNEQNLVIAVVHQSILGLHMGIGKIFWDITDVCRPDLGKTINWNNSLIKYDPKTHIATFRFEQAISEGCTGTAIYSIDLLKRRIIMHDAEIILPKEVLSTAAEKFLCGIEGEDPEHFVFGVVDRTAPSWRDTLFALMKELEARENELAAVITKSDCDQELREKARSLLQEVSFLRHIMRNIFRRDGEELLTMELFKDAQHCLNISRQVVDMEIRCLKGKTLPPLYEVNQLQKQLDQLGSRSNSIGRAIKNAFRKMADKFSDLFQSFFNKFRDAEIVAKEAQEQALLSLHNGLQESAKVLIGSIDKQGLCLDAKATTREPSLPVLGDMEVHALSDDEDETAETPRY